MGNGSDYSGMAGMVKDEIRNIGEEAGLERGRISMYRYEVILHGFLEVGDFSARVS
jgi:hypothetical protein